MTSSTTSKYNSSSQGFASSLEHVLEYNSAHNSDPLSENKNINVHLYQLRTNSGNILTPQDIEKKLKLSIGLFEAAFEIKKHQLRKKHPEKSEKELNHLTMNLIEKGTL